MPKLAGKVALITGSGGGIGEVAAKLFAREGAKVVVAELAEEQGMRVAGEISAAGHAAKFVKVDVTKAESVKGAVDFAVKQFGGLNILYNNVGGTGPGDGPVTEVEEEELWLSMRRDFLSAWLGCKYGIPELVKAGGGSVINMASVVAIMGKPRPAQDCYTASKGAIVSFTRSVAVHHAPDKVRVNAIAPGLTMTPRVSGMISRGVVPAAMTDKHLLGMVEPSDVANAALFLASDDSRMITGHILPVDSGVSMS